MEAVEQAAFNFLAVLDGVASAVTDDTPDMRYELLSVTKDSSLLLNDPNSEELHRLFSRTNAVSHTEAQQTLQAYEVGEFAELKQRQSSADCLHLHRVPPKFAASKRIAGYDPATASSIALPQGEHRRVESE